MASDQTPIFNVSDFVASLNQTLEYAYPIVEIEGEVANFKINQGKWVFFDLKDETTSVGCFMSLYSLRVQVEDGMKVLVRASPKVTQWGKFSLTIQSIRPSGEGSIKKSFRGGQSSSRYGKEILTELLNDIIISSNKGGQ